MEGLLAGVEQAVPTGAGAVETGTTLLVGNPNVGKSVLFGVLTGRYAEVSNYPGTTVELTRGRVRDGSGEVLDLPGANGLLPDSEDERVTRDVLLENLGTPGLRVIQVCDTKTLHRGLALTLQLAELAIPQVLVANMADEARSRGYTLRREALAQTLGIPVLETVATRRQGVAPLLGGGLTPRVAEPRVAYPPPVEAALAGIERLLPPGLPASRGLALVLLAGGPAPSGGLPPFTAARQAVLDAIRERTAHALPEGIRTAVARARLALAEEIASACLARTARAGPGWLARLGVLALHPVWGLPLAGLVLYAVYWFVGVLGAGTVVDWLENGLFGALLVPWLDTGLRWMLPAFAEPFLIGPPGAEPGTGPGLLLGDFGLISMGLSYAFAIVLPIVGFFFLTFSVLEDSGYLPRLAVLLNRAFKVIGLNGKAVLPMILGLGCDTMATMTARILTTHKERVLVTLLLALGVPCSAQLGVILGMLAALSGKALLIWLGTLAGVMVLVGWLANQLLPGQGSRLVLEIPPMRLPAIGNIVVKTLARVEWYLREVVPLFLLGTFALWLLHTLNLLKTVESWAAPVVQGLLGLPAQATQAFLIGFLRRDYGAAGLYDLFNGALAAPSVAAETEIQVVVSLVTLTLFVPCIANLFMIIKERGLRTALAMAAFIFPFAFLVGGALNAVLRWVW